VKSSPCRADEVGANRDKVALPNLPRLVGGGRAEISVGNFSESMKFPG
jgi:hypothetical protein